MKIVVVGGGAAGLTAAFELHKAGRQVVVLESSPRVGGVIASKTMGGFDLDLGPNSLVCTPALQARIDALGLGQDVLEAASVSKNRYLVKDRTLYALSPHPVKLLKSPYLSWGAKSRIFTERFRAKGGGGDESVGAFFARRFGREITEAVVDPIFSGIYAGDIARLSLEQVLPVAGRWEQTYGSVIKGMMKEKETLKGGRKIINFKGGLQRLTDALAAPLAGNIHTGVAVSDIRFEGDRFLVTHSGGILEADRVIYTGPPGVLAGVPVDYASVRTLHVTVPEDALDLPPGFGFLVPSRERLALMGCIFTSSIFPSKAPEGQALLTLMTGGAHHAGEQVEDLQERALDDLKAILRVRGTLRVLHGQTWRSAIPQKNLGHAQVLATLKAYEDAHPGFYFAGSAVSGVSVGDTMEYAAKVVHSIV
ncbi:protoporphyrinogen oxidase [Dinghuibacter silviterrae]|uniref:Coproporphyrinogen III oxidase n=1 Tax=Dinghuibacter silviterrae TaxID=1539049 RepID=A0A4R8DEQ9_9BACT|nr:protoporphyrinogen oxidase [Dinghuibacter silviterrae]TDW95738.1 oxygen-dependent protoporphyrinogen oxidase [Dinghuibacter silviterrae]